jgi:putative salt-induced outer membrane protein YdiY
MNKPSRYRSFMVAAILMAAPVFPPTLLGADSPVAPADAKKGAWDKSAALGLTLTSGNSETVLGTASLLASKKDPENEWSLGLDGAYGKNNHVKSVETLHGFGQYNHLFSDRSYGYMRLDGLHDSIADLEYRGTFSPGAGYYLLKDSAKQFSVEGGPAFIYEKQGSDKKGYVSLRIAERFDYKLNDRAKIWESVEVLPQVDHFKNFLVNSELGIETKITEQLGLRAVLQNNYDNEPAIGRKKNDIRLVTAIAYHFK